MKRNMELLAPGGDIDSIKAAILAGADAVYCGLDKFNARNRAANISFADLNGILRLAHKNKCQVFLTLNIIIVESEIPALIQLLNKLVNTSIDGIIIQDLGLFYLISTHFKSLKIHASTQLTTHNEGQIRFLGKLNATRANLSRELSLPEISILAAVAKECNMLTEVFVHGSYCLSFSGICYMSSVHGGNSGNRGRCSQPCRDRYDTTQAGFDFPLNLKDNSAFTSLKELYDAGVDSLKIEGRIKKFHYVYSIVEAWRKHLQRFYSQNQVTSDKSSLYKVFNRDFSDGFLKGTLPKNMFIDNARDHSALHLAASSGNFSMEKLEKAKGDVYHERTDIITTVEEKISRISIAKAPLFISISGEAGTPLKIVIRTPDASTAVYSRGVLVTATDEKLTEELLLSRLKALNETEYYIEKMDLLCLNPNVFLSFKELTIIKKKLLYFLNRSREFVEPIALPELKKHKNTQSKPILSVLISSPADLYLAAGTDAFIYFQLPDSLQTQLTEVTDLFAKNRKLIPWFSSIIIGDDYCAAIEFLDKVKPQCIVTNNTGIAFEANNRGISWIAGPNLNLVNSYSLRCLKENFGCSGAFISNELNRIQIKGIKKPNDFDLYYSIYHPIELMTTRQCLIHTTSGCEKEAMDGTCLPHCEKSAVITNLKKDRFFLEKQKGNYHRVFSQTHFLNVDAVHDLADTFSTFLLDLRDIKTETHTTCDKKNLIVLFSNLIAGTEGAKEELLREIHPTTYAQYRKGI